MSQISEFLDSLLDPRMRLVLARIFLLMGMIGPGLALFLDSAKWGEAPELHQLSSLSVPLWVLGLLLCAFSFLMIKGKTRDIAYVFAAMFYFVVNVSAIISVINDQANSALIFALPVLCWVYLEAAINATREEARVSTPYTEPFKRR